MQAIVYNFQNCQKVLRKFYTQNGLKIKILEDLSLNSLKRIYNELDDEFVIINANYFFDLDFNLAFEYAKAYPTLIPLYFANSSESTTSIYSGAIHTNSDNLVIKNNEYFVDSYIKSGVACLRKDLINIKSKATNIKEFFTEIFMHKLLYALPFGGILIDTREENAEEKISTRINMPKKPALFLDRDNLLIKDDGYTTGTNIICLNIADEYIKKANNAKEYAIVVSNQSGVARGFFTEEDVHKTNAAVKRAYQQKGLILDDFYICPYHTTGTVNKYVHASKLRKPAPGMLLEACKKYRIDLKNSLMLGDNPDTDNINLPYIKSIILK